MLAVDATPPAVAAALSAVRAERCRRSLHQFVREFWSVVVPGSEFQDNWHIEAICQHLQAVSEGRIKRLLINVPFRTAKSTITSVLWPAWQWIDRPTHQWLCGSYAEKLALRDSLQMRRLVTSPQYQAWYGGGVTIAKDQSQKVRWQNTAGGHRIAFGMTGGVMGDGGDTLLIDDPHDRQGAHSDAERTAALTTYDEALTNRLNDPAHGAIVIIMQRLAHNDLSGHVLKQREQGWVHLMIPMEFEPARRCVTRLGWRDPRKEAGELMFPHRFPRKTVDAQKLVMGTYGTAGQYQQRPSPEGGGRLQVRHFQLWPAGKPLPDFDFVVQSYDTAYTRSTQNDPTAQSTWGTFTMGKRRCAMLLECWSKFMGYPELREKVLADWKHAEYGGIPDDALHPARRADMVLVEDKGSGISLLQDLRAGNVPVRGYNPGGADKIGRAEIAAPLLEADVFYVLESKREPALPVRWARPFVEQLEQFPNAEHDDWVDTFTQVVIYLRDANLLAPDVVEEDPEVERDYHKERKARANPYGA